MLMRNAARFYAIGVLLAFSFAAASFPADPVVRLTIDRLDPYVQDALDLIAFANAPASTLWGAKRAAMGHPEPFRMKYLGIGNEQWDEVVMSSYAPLFAKAGATQWTPDLIWFDNSEAYVTCP